jgi:hypothetical protein
MLSLFTPGASALLDTVCFQARMNRESNMNQTKLLLHIVLLTLLLATSCLAQVAVVVAPTANGVEKLAATELVTYLKRMYPAEQFTITARAPASGSLVRFERRSGLPESFFISASGGEAVIASADPRGSLFAVYALLEKLGCGFYLSYETVPTPRPGPMQFNGWSLTDAPVFRDRIVFDWHNFLSSASTWEFEDWQRYIDNALRMRFNDLMVHAYGNNPMFTFRFAGMNKPVGFLATTRSGRDWGTQHVNDVRRMVGGELFNEPVFGASIAQVDNDHRVPAAVGLMQRVFAHAAGQGMGVTFALDVDTESANPQEMIAKLPASARIAAGKYVLANPDTAEGYSFYKAQVDQLLATYPQISRLAVWFRPKDTPWADVKFEDFPAAWKQEFHGDPADAPMFAIGKLVAVFGRALKESGHGTVELAAGSWRLDFLKSADHYLPGEATLLPLDGAIVLDTPAGQRALRNVRSGRKLVPIVWAHHDDRTYIGRPYTPYMNFATLLKNSGGSGFGIIHWTTRPLDVYFKGTIAQAWSASESQPLEEACESMAVRTFGEAARDTGRDYLFSWVTEGPMFGRETSDRFIDVPLIDAANHIKKSKERLHLLEKIDPVSLPPNGREFLAYYKGYEEFIQAFFETQSGLERSQAEAERGDFTKAREELGQAKPEDVIRAYVRAARQGTITSGEKALVVSLNLRWLPCFVSMRQAVGLEPVRVRIGKVEREPLAEGVGTNTFHFDEQSRVWKVLEPAPGTREIRLTGIMGNRLQPGRYSINGGHPVEARNGSVTVQLHADLQEIVVSRVP